MVLGKKRGHGENVVMDGSFSSQEEYSCVKKKKKKYGERTFMCKKKFKMWGTFLHSTERNKN